jgi:predicted transcriptional regulator
MKTDRLTKVFERVEQWPAHARDELAAIAQELDAELQGQVYVPTAEELEGIDRGLRDAAAGRFATEEEVEAVFAKFRGR